MQQDLQAYHRPVLLKEAVEALCVKKDGVYVDLTFGGGGHSRGILEQLGRDGVLWAFDQDPDAMIEAKKIKQDALRFVQGNFRFVGDFLRAYGVEKVDGILADLGVSSHQLDTASRGFAARLGGPLDMRMHQHGEETAAQVVTTYGEAALARLFRVYGDVPCAGRLAKMIVAARRAGPIVTVERLREVIAPCVPRQRAFKFLAKVFQALRMTVNDEVAALHDMLYQVPDLLAPGGRFVVITYHAGEDRPVKRFIKTGNMDGRIVQDMYGHVVRPLRPVYRRSLPSTEGGRGRSARMRVATLEESKG